MFIQNPVIRTRRTGAAVSRGIRRPAGGWAGREGVAPGTVRRPSRQLRANLREMETLCGLVRREDAQALDKLVRPIRERASKAAHDFLKLHAETANLEPAALCRHSEEALGGWPAAQDHASGAEEHESPQPAQAQLLLPEIPQDQNAAESWESLEEDLLELNGLVNEFSELVHVSIDHH
ncbi:syntaxin-17 isoform X1 [Arapaima gigas]